MRTARDRNASRVVKVGVWRFPADQTLRAISAGGPACDSFEPFWGGGFGSFEESLGIQMSGELMGEQASGWRRVGANRFVPPRQPDGSRIFVEWRREGNRWVVSVVGDQTIYSPRVAGSRAWRPGEVRRAAWVPQRPRYAEETEWYRQNTPIVLDGFRYLKYGLPRPIGAELIELIGHKDGVPVYAARGETGAPGVIYALADPSRYQPYQEVHGRPQPCSGR
ncbi:MAG: hypothetical protein ICV87_00340 [Gemmatimonadetes bacterium]|nr:hypothetical protein [Gemmatimonadota bacterium]